MPARLIVTVAISAAGLISAFLPATATSMAPKVNKIVIDRGFGVDGTLITRRAKSTVGDPVAIGPKGGFGLAGGSIKQMYFERFDSRGRPVRSFGSDGIVRVGSADKYQPRVTADFDGRGRALLILDTQKQHPEALKIMRLTRRGRIDRGFGTREVTWITPPDWVDASHAWFVFDGSGAISVVGAGNLWRLLPSGKPDSRIGPGGLFRPVECGDENREMSVTFVSPARADGSLYIEKSCTGPDQAIRVDRDGNESPATLVAPAPMELDLSTYPDARGGFLGVDSGDGPDRDCAASRIVRVGSNGLLDPTFGNGGMLTRHEAGIRVPTDADSPVFDLTLLRNGTAWVYCGEETPHWPRFRVSASELAPNGAVKSFVRPTRLTLTGVQIEEAYADPRGPGSMLVWGYKKRGISLTRLKLSD